MGGGANHPPSSSQRAPLHATLHALRPIASQDESGTLALTGSTMTKVKFVLLSGLRGGKLVDCIDREYMAKVGGSVAESVGILYK